MATINDVKELQRRIGVGSNVATELLILSGGSVAMAEQASLASNGLDQCKSRIIDNRFRQLESVIFEED